MTVEYINGHLAHFFPCGAWKCKSPIGGVRRYQDSKDKSSTANLKQHAKLCFGKEAVHSWCKGVIPSGPSGTIYAGFGCQNHQPVTHTSLHVHTNNETRQEIHFNVHVHLWQDFHRSQLVRWITESNHPINIINDRLLCDLLTAGRPSITVPYHLGQQFHTTYMNPSKNVKNVSESCFRSVYPFIHVFLHLIALLLIQ